MKVSFVLPKEHCLGRNHLAALIDLVTGFMLMDIGELQDMEEEIVSNHLPTNAEVSSVVASQVPCMEAVCCEESVNDFNVKIIIQTNEDDPKGKTL